MEDIIRISKVKSEEYELVLQFVQKYYDRAYGTSPQDLLNVCFAAWRGNTILGAIGLEISQNGELLEVENFFDLQEWFLHESRNETVNFGRWASIEAVSGKALAFRAVEYSLVELGKKFAIAVSKPRVLRYIRKAYGLKFSSFHVPLRKLEGVKFFWDGPDPVMYTWKLEDWYLTLGKDIPTSIHFDR